MGDSLYLMKRVVAVEVQVLTYVGLLVHTLNLEAPSSIMADIYIQEKQMLLAIVLTLCLNLELNVGILLVQKVGEVDDICSFEHLYHIIYIPVPVCRFDVQRTQTQSVAIKLLHLQITGSCCDVVRHGKTCLSFVVECTLTGENGGIH